MSNRDSWAGPIGPFWMQRATAATLHETWGWAYVYLRNGCVVMIEWLD